MPVKKTAQNLASDKAPKETTTVSFINGHTLETVEESNIKTPYLNILFNPKGAVLREISFPSYINSETQKPIQIFSTKEAELSPTFIEIIQDGQVKPVLDYEIENQGKGLEAVAIQDGLKILKTHEIGKRYESKFTISFENTSASQKDFEYNLVVGPDFPPRHSVDAQFIEANFFQSNSENKVLKHIRSPKPDKSIDSPGNLDWIAVKDRHFSFIVKPLSDKFSGRVTGFKNHHFRANLASQKIRLAPGTKVQHEFKLYAGPNILDELEPLGLGDIINFGKFDWIAKALVGTLELLHKAFHNYGLAIIALTFLINLVLFPFTRNSFLSMKRMQLIQPQINRLRENHKNNPERLHKEMMELYKKHKVNPFGGCLPMILQLPIFVALYVAISKSVSLINSKFLWAKDLTSPDKIHLPFSLPVIGNELHLLPLIMMGAMIMQQKFTQIKMEGQDPQIEAQQKMMAVTMPIVFVFIFYSMPSGLVLYWLTNTIIMALYQMRLKNMTLS